MTLSCATAPGAVLVIDADDFAGQALVLAEVLELEGWDAQTLTMPESLRSKAVRPL